MSTALVAWLAFSSGILAGISIAGREHRRALRSILRRIDEACPQGGAG